MVTQFFIWLGKKLATVVLTVIVTLWLTGLIMTSVVQSILEEYEIPLQVEPTIYTGVLGYLWGFQQGDNNQTTLLSDNNEQKEPTKNTNEDEQSDDPTQSSQKTENEIDEESSIEVFAPVELEGEVEISKNELGLTKQGLTEQEKERLMQLLVERIPADQWQTISLYLEDGLSEKELLDTQQILAQHLNDEEYSELMEILKKS